MNQLTRLSDFQNVLKNYQPSDKAKALLAETNLVLLVGPSSSGRNTIMNELLKSGRYHNIVSDTTRLPRTKNGTLIEENGREYWFRAEADILHDLEAGEFLEAAIIHNQQVSGISMRELLATANKGQVAITDIEIVGAETIHAVKPDALLVFILPPSFDEWMARMQFRGELPAAETRRRLESAVEEITTALGRDYYNFLVNDTFMQTTKQLDAMVEGQHRDSEAEAHGRQIAEQLLVDTRAYLAREA